MRRCLSVWHLAGLAVAGLVIGALVGACSNSKASGFGDGGSGSGGSGGSGSTGGGSSGTAAGSSSTPIGLKPTGDGSVPPQSDASCAGSTSKAEQSPLDIYIMLDQSASMSENSKWKEVTAAIESFVVQTIPGISVGLQYFGVPGSGPAGDSCTAADYAKPAVAIAPIPGVGSAITASINAHSPSTDTPTYPAVQGMIQYCQTWATANPSHVVIGLLATDGMPTECNIQDITSIDKVAAAGVSGTPKILTYVIGVGSSVANLNSLAAAGGTTKAFMVSTTGNITQQFTAALEAIRGAALGCQYKIPTADGGAPNYNQVNVVYSQGSGSGSGETIPKVASASACPADASTTDGWYYDDPTAPTEILLCGSTCAKAQGAATASIDVEIGCATITSTIK